MVLYPFDDRVGGSLEDVEVTMIQDAHGVERW
jgi:hypothetical protein